MKDEPTIIILAITALLILEVLAILRGLNGAYFGIVIAAISGLAGYELKAIKDKIKLI